MTARETVRAALRNLARRPLRNGLATVGVVLATASLVALLGLSAGIETELLGRVSDVRLHAGRVVEPAAAP